ncbi:heme o synthase [Rhizobacter sp. Root1221]|uniref:heme o synthase n=1 Tax=Rhizobacter sp. Root1221 TaxID=1736433 RepID=UPI0006FFB346|nr:heme o synthase [Rhizobacter sp. Root1221]KQV85495.1 protoheme IX farnesyltransferase [Rhizobacter sp. Root1221]
MAHAVGTAAARAPWRRYVELTKPRVVALMVFTVAVGMMLAAPQGVPWRVGLFGTAGIAMLACSAAALNHLIDRRVDAVMARTRARPLPSGTLQSVQAAAFAAVLGAGGTALLVAFTNNLCAVLTLASLVGYAGVYSLFLKRSTPQNIVIGGAAGAAPPLLGWVAVTGHLDAGGIVLFLIILVWTPPHFWALAIHRRDDYARAALPMLPVTHGVPFTCRRILGYTLLLWAVSLLPVAIGMAHLPYLVGAAVLGGRFTWLAWRLRQDTRLAMPVFRFSIAYLAALFALLLVDHWFTPGGG